MNWPVFHKRALSSVVYVVVMLAGLLIPDPFAIIVLALLIQFLCFREFFKIMEKIFPGTEFSKTLIGCIQVLAVVVVMAFVLFKSILPVLLLPIPLVILLPSVLSKKTALRESFISLIGLLYISLPMASLISLRKMGLWFPLALVVMIWINDTMAYITGSFIGKTALSPISPKKTWEGTIGGIIFTLIVAGIWAWLLPFNNIPVYLWIVLAVIASGIGTFGDLFESKLKRMAGVKDSGNIMPGHGGALDRFDSLLAALPFAALAVFFVLP